MMNKIFLTIGIIVTLILVGFLVYQTFLSYQEVLKEKESLSVGTEIENQEDEELLNEEETTYLEPAKALNKRSIAIVIAPQDTQSGEYLKIRQIFRAAGAEITTASTSEGLELSDFDAVVFIEDEITALVGEEPFNIKDSASPEDFAMRIVEVLTGI
jgi:hypothetical protein